MQVQRKPLLLAAAAAALVGTGAWAASAHSHIMQIRLADGEIVRVAYAGDVAPRVIVQPVAVPAASPVAARDPFMAMSFPGFGQIDRMFADLHRQQAIMMQQAVAMQRDMAAHGAGAIPASASQHSANGAHWSYVSSTTTSNGCTQTVQWRSAGAAAQAQPQVIRTSAGNCDKAAKEAPAHQAAAVQPQPKTPPGQTI